MTSGPWHANQWQALRELPGRIPLRIKLITAVLALVAIALSAISVAGISFLRTYLIGQADQNLQVVSQTYAPRIGPCLNGGFVCPAYFPVGEAVEWLTPQGKLYPIVMPQAGSGLPGPAPNIAAAAGWLISHPGQAITVGATSGSGRWRLLSYPAPVPMNDGTTRDGILVAALDVTNVYNTVGRLARIDLIVSAIVVAALAVAGVAMVRSSLRPLTDIERTARKIASGDLSQRVPDSDPQTEVGRLGWALNTMLAQIEAAFHARAESERAARVSEERMRQFVADASHELRTPVTVIRGYAEYYRQRGGLGPAVITTGADTPGQIPPGQVPPGHAAAALPPAPGVPAVSNGARAAGLPADGQLGRVDIDRIMERVEQESTRMGGLVEDMLLLARLDQQRPIERHPVDLLTLAGDAVQDARAIAPGRKIELSVGAGTAFLVLGDEARLRQVIANLMSNALTHTPDGTEIDVRVGSGQRTGYPPAPGVILEVADKGPGIPPEQASRVFERFYRADQSRGRRTGGTGLGLAIVSALVTAHGGTVSLDTVPGHGATFRITLPLDPHALQAEEPPAEGEPSAGGPGHDGALPPGMP